jgi:hypothetical protein
MGRVQDREGWHVTEVDATQGGFLDLYRTTTIGDVTAGN